MRADARRNYEAIIAVAQRHLSHKGVDTSLEAIAEEAGVGIATLYRHFPDRDHLVFAALNVQGEHLRDTAGTLRTSEPPDTRLERWLAEVESYLCSYQGLPASIASALDCDEKSPLAINCQEIIAVTDDFVHEARQRGLVQDHVTGSTLFEATLMLAWLGAQLPDGDSTDGIRRVLAYGYRSPQSPQ